MPSTLSSFLYSSRLAPGCALKEVGKLVKQARELNAMHGITGVLVFDGEMFAQYVEGPADAIATLVENLAKDPRHIDFRPLMSNDQVEMRRYASWAMGYSDIELDGLDIEQLAEGDGDSALQLFSKAVAEIDSL